MRSLSKSKWMEAVQSYVLYFFFYSVLGWLYEVFLEVVVYRWGFTNRGVLLGPYCPVYGVGALVFLLAFSRLMAKREPAWFRWVKPVLVFLGCMIAATAIELATSYLLEALTGAWPWQTYRDYAINFEGRIALSPSIRFGLGMLMSFYLDEGFQMEDLDLAAGVRREEYYVKMMAAWYFATALAKQYDAALPYLRQRRLDRWTHNKTIQKAVESYRITPEQKDELRSLRWKDCAKEEGV